MKRMLLSYEFQMISSESNHKVWKTIKVVDRIFSEVGGQSAAQELQHETEAKGAKQTITVYR